MRYFTFALFVGICYFALCINAAALPDSPESQNDVDVPNHNNIPNEGKCNLQMLNI